MTYITYIHWENGMLKEAYTAEANDGRNVGMVEDKFLEKIKELGVPDDEEIHHYIDDGFYQSEDHLVELIYSDSINDEE